MAVISDKYLGLVDMGSCAIWRIVTNVSEVLSATIFRVARCLVGIYRRFLGNCRFHIQDRRVDVTPYMLLDRCQRFGGTCCFCLRDIRVHVTAFSLIDRYQYFGGKGWLNFQGKGDSTFLRNVSNDMGDYTMARRRRQRCS
jgi:hypothetical protein